MIEQGGDVFGTVVNKAARIAAIAAPGEIWLFDATRIMVGGATPCAFSEPASVPLKYLEGEQVVYRLEWQP
jgi:adenylate cyclase